MQPIFLIAHIIVCFVLILLVLLQQGKGASAGVLSGGAGSQTVFGSKGAGGFLFKLTAAFAALFIISCLLLSYIANKASKPAHAVEQIVKHTPVTKGVMKKESLDRLIDDVVQTKSSKTTHPASHTKPAKAGDQRGA